MFPIPALSFPPFMFVSLPPLIPPSHARSIIDNKTPSKLEPKLTGASRSPLAAKQEAFEESTRLTNQFRSLDEDEIEFLDSVQESTRAREAAVKQDTKEHLDEFRRQQEAAERAAKELEQGVADVPPESGENWAAGPRKRKKGREVLGGVKIRRKGSGEGMKKEEGAEMEDDAEKKKDSSPPVKERVEEKKPSSSASPSPPAPPAIPAGLGLGAYSSDEDDD